MIVSTYVMTSHLYANHGQKVNRNLRTVAARVCSYNAHMNDSPPIAQKLREIRTAAGVGVREMARRMGISPSTYQHYENPKLFKNKFLPLEFAQTFSNAIGDPDAVKSVLKLAGVDFNQSIRSSNNLSTNQVGGLVRVDGSDVSPENAKLIAVQNVEASAGSGSVVGEEYTQYSLAFPPDYLQSITSAPAEHLSIITVKGESMEPTLLHKDIVLLDTSKKDLSYDGLFVLRFNDALHVKRIGRSPRRDHVTIISDNRALYPPIEIAMQDVEPVGKVLWYGRKV